MDFEAKDDYCRYIPAWHQCSAMAMRRKMHYDNQMMITRADELKCLLNQAAICPEGSEDGPIRNAFGGFYPAAKNLWH